MAILSEFGSVPCLFWNKIPFFSVVSTLLFTTRFLDSGNSYRLRAPPPFKFLRLRASLRDLLVAERDLLRRDPRISQGQQKIRLKPLRKFSLKIKDRNGVIQPFEYAKKRTLKINVLAWHGGWAHRNSTKYIDTLTGSQQQMNTISTTIPKTFLFRFAIRCLCLSAWFPGILVFHNRVIIGHSRVPLSLSFKASLSASLLIW